MNTNIENFEIGDLISSLSGDGIVVNKICNGIYTIIVKFQDGKRKSYTASGHYNIHDKYPSIWHRYEKTEPFLTEKTELFLTIPTWCWCWNEGEKSRNTKKLILTQCGDYYLSETELFEFAQRCDAKDIPTFWPKEWI